jgi:hypothetical protein
VWDIELDLGDELATAKSGPLPDEASGKKHRNRAESPPWDIELDLNPSDDDESTNEKQTFEPTSLL